jgi:cytochrome c peroxidase
LFIGGLFWDGRATGRMDVTATGGLGSGPTGDPLADQAKGPFGNPVEMALTLENTGKTTEVAVVDIIKASDYADKFTKNFGDTLYTAHLQAYNQASIAIAAFERSKTLNKFNSKFDKFVKEQGGDVSGFGWEDDDGIRKYVGLPPGFKSKVYTDDEADGFAIFNSDSYKQLLGQAPPTQNGGSCHLCHLTDNHVVSESDTWRPLNGPAPGIYNPIFTDFSYDNLGIPVNFRIAELAGPQDIDLGLGGQVAQLDAAYGEEYPNVAEEEGKFKVSSLRNLSRTAPYGHNGFFATIFDIVNFYNTRDVLPECVDAGQVVGVDCWPAAEVPATVNIDELGDLGLTTAQVQKIVLFLETLSD